MNRKQPIAPWTSLDLETGKVTERKAPKRVNCLLASEREKDCTQHAFSYSGRVPCTGLLKCIYCNTLKSDTE